MHKIKVTPGLWSEAERRVGRYLDKRPDGVVEVWDTDERLMYRAYGPKHVSPDKTHTSRH